MPPPWGSKVPSRPGRSAVASTVWAIYPRYVKHILLAIDRSAPSWEAARLATRLAPKLKASVTVLSVLVPEPRRGDAKDQYRREYEAVRELVDDVVKELVVARVKANGEVRSGTRNEVAGEILRTATRLATEMILMGSRARGELTGLLLGSVSHEVAMGARCPVVIVPASTMTTVTPRRIVLVINGEGDPERPVATTVELARALKASVEVVCVGLRLGGVAEDAKSTSSASPDEAAVAGAVGALKKAGVEARSHMIDNRRGLAPEIAREVMATAADMIVLGTRTLGWEGVDVPAGAAGAVIHRTRRPVVIAPSRGRS
jgi:nucleotide-binding universal stress UspA family protein